MLPTPCSAPTTRRDREEVYPGLLNDALSLLRVTHGPNQLGLVAKNVKEYVWLCRYLGQR